MRSPKIQSCTVNKLNFLRKSMIFVMLGTGILFSAHTRALTFYMPSHGNVIGEMKSTTVKRGETLSTIGRHFDIGGYEMKEANPGIRYLRPPVGKRLTIPSRFVLPSGARKGIVVNLAEMRLYFYHPNGKKVSTYPIGIGKSGWTTPLGTTSIVRKRKNPTWVVPESIWINHARQGKFIPKVKPPGPDNPLGKYAMSLGFKNIVIHGTPYPMGVGVRSSHGCIRMLPEDIAQLFRQVPMGTQVRIVHEPVKVGHLNGKVFLESHVPLSEAMYPKHQRLSTLVNYVSQNAKVNWSTAQKIQKRARGFPEVIGRTH